MIEKLIAEATASGGSERANYQLFIRDLCDALGLERPQMTSQQNALNDYVFERRIDFKHPNGTRSPGFIDCYKRGHFVLEAKQTVKRGAKALDPDQLSLLGEDAGQVKSGHATRGTRGWDQVMLSAVGEMDGRARYFTPR